MKQLFFAITKSMERQLVEDFIFPTSISIKWQSSVLWLGAKWRRGPLYLRS